jgi:hypothetical protein
MTTIRPYREDDRAAVEGLGLAVIEPWTWAPARPAGPPAGQHRGERPFGRVWDLDLIERELTR